MNPKPIHINVEDFTFTWRAYPESKSCIKHQLDEQRDLRSNDAFPPTVTENNTGIRQQFFDVDDVDFDYIGNQLGIDVVTVSAILQEPGNFIPIHRDTFYQIKQRFPDDKRTKVRANIFLEDWQPGHVIQYQAENSWKTIDNWKAGEGIMWSSNTPHIGANVGLNNKYTMQVSGFLKD